MSNASIYELLVFSQDLIETLREIEGQEELAEAYKRQLLAIQSRALAHLIPTSK